ncbi:MULTISPECIES: anti-phage dCTP deaminase [unclassified Mesorhizobium]|uniref:anti-phage dCTP deaminase n=1 Tax=unclassified Mesorhizobium TaxID=325217 RepID=UPI003014E13E
MATKTFKRPDIECPEIVIGIVSPVGTDVTGVISALHSSFKKMNYDIYHIKLSKIMGDIAKPLSYNKLVESNKYSRINSYIDFGNYLRENLGNDILSAMAIASIVENRLSDKLNKGFERKIYIVDQLKTEDELHLLSEVYGKSFFQISVYSARDIRVDNLSKAMAHDEKRGDRNAFRDKAEFLVVRDEDERDVPHGQKVGKIFQYADLVLNADKVDDLNKIDRQVDRFVDLLFGSNRYSPNRLEYGMFVAHSAALRSLDLSRQVGAAIFRSSGEIACLGSNEVPKAGGGTYWADDIFDAREYKLHGDSNDARKEELLNEVLEIALGKGFRLGEEKTKQLERSQFMDALEYGRIVHAEMCALSDAARLGIQVVGGTIYCTTFPCHMCSKHIVASGIAKVVFLEPYPKSLTSDLHSDSVKIEGSSRGIYEKYPSVEYVPFFGITPRRYRELFARSKRKQKGRFVEFQGDTPRPIISMIAPWYMQRESEIIDLAQLSISAFINQVWSRKPA